MLEATLRDQGVASDIMEWGLDSCIPFHYSTITIIMSKSGPSNPESATYSSWWFTLGYSIWVFVLSILLQLHQLLRLILLQPLVLGSRRQSQNSKIPASYGNRTIWTRLTWDLVEVILAIDGFSKKFSLSFVFFHVLFPKLSFSRR